MLGVRARAVRTATISTKWSRSGLMNRPTVQRTPSARSSGAASTISVVCRPRTLPMTVIPSGGMTLRARSLATASQPRVSGVSSAMPARTMMAARVAGRGEPVDQVGTPDTTDRIHSDSSLIAHLPRTDLARAESAGGTVRTTSTWDESHEPLSRFRHGTATDTSRCPWPSLSRVRLQVWGQESDPDPSAPSCARSSRRRRGLRWPVAR